MIPKTILYVIGSLNLGGAERHLAELLPRLDRARWKPVVFCLTEKGQLASHLEAQGIPVFASRALRPEAAQSRLRRAVRIAGITVNLAAFTRRLKPSIVHFFLPASYILGAPAALLARVPVRIMSRRSLNNYQRNHGLAHFLEPKLHGRMSAILGNSRSVVQQLEQEEHVARSRLGLIYNGIDIVPYREAATSREATRQELGIQSNAVVMSIVANLIPYKGHGDLLAALGGVAPRLPDGWRLLMIGRDDGIGEALRAKAEKLGIAENILWLGSRLDVPALLNASDIGLLCSHEEGFSNAILEGMAASLPMIVTDVGGNSEAVISEECGLVVPPRDPRALGEAIARLASDFGLMRRFGAEAQKRVAAVFTFDRCVRAYEELYTTLLAGGETADCALCRFEN